MNTTLRVSTTVSEDCSLTLENLPFAAGQKVEVTVQLEPAQGQRTNRRPLWGSVKDYDQPTDSVAKEDWETNAPVTVGADRQELESAYREMAADETREAEALEWSEAMIGDVADEAR